VFSGGDVVEPLHPPKAEGDRKQGTTVRVWPDAKYFESPHLPMGELTHLLRSKAVLMPGVSVTLVNEKTRDTQTWQYKGGLRDYLQQTLNGEPVIPLFEGEGFADSSHDSFAEGEGASWCRGLHRRRPAGARELRQPDPHQRRRHARQRPARRPVQAVKSFIELHSLLPKGVKLMPEDVFARASYVLSAKVLDPQFQGQIKERLNSRDAVRLVSALCAPRWSCG
jgi:topoisomerase-4 subunit B